MTLKKVKVESKAEKAPVPQATGGIAARTFARKAAADAKVAEAKVRSVNVKNFDLGH